MLRGYSWLRLVGGVLCAAVAGSLLFIVTVNALKISSLQSHFVCSGNIATEICGRSAVIYVVGLITRTRVQQYWQTLF